jgi:DNA repair exonuclease SbcCD ATPase subunit
MVANTTTQRGKRFNYYRCSYAHRGHPRCDNKKLLRAEATEELVWAFVRDLVSDPDALLYQWNTAIDAQIADLSGDPEKRRRSLASRIVELDEKRKRAQDLAVDGLIDADDLRGRLQQIASERATASQELEAAERIAQIEASRNAFPEFLRTSRERLQRATPEDQRMTYEDLNLTLWADDGEIINLTGSFERIGYPTEEEMIQREREAFAKLEREELECEERAGLSTNESCSSMATAPTGDPCSSCE